MKYGFCALPVAPMRAEASDRAEMVSQLLFGDTFVVEEYSEKWTLIVADFDGYRGWVD
ncbi:MAG: SH3 domain-containing protein, partial [Bacteroidales bacterium]|nr:SH3 domain-containing protein [Bacteroidales bacterium]